MGVMNTAFTYPERVAVARLHALLELLPTALDKRLKPSGITGFEYTVLEILAEAPGNSMRMSEIATKTNATLPRLSRVANSLERRGLTERASCPEDARATNLVLTDEGTKAHAHSQALYAEAVRELILDGVQQLPGDGVQQLADIAYAVLSSLDPDRKGGLSTFTNPAEESPGDCAADPSSPLGDATIDCAADPALEHSA